MADVDPFMVQIPPKLMEDKETREFFEYFVRWAHDMWIRSGAGDDAVANESIQELFPWVPLPSESVVDLRALFPKTNINGKVFDVISVTADHTTSGNEILICNNTTPILITCNATPDQEEEIYIKRRSSPVNVISTKGIDGETMSKRIALKYDSPHLIFTTEADEFSII